MQSEIQLQREYYTRTAGQYESMHVSGHGEHDLACMLITALARYHGFESILDVGCGTGRAVKTLSLALPEVNVVGVEPVEALRKVGHGNGIPPERLIAGDGTQLSFEDDAFDVVCEFGVLHHVPKPRRMVAEMVRTARRAVFISDSNRFGQGSGLARFSKLVLHRMGLWPVVDRLKTGGKGYVYGEGDGVSYSYSAFDDYRYLRSRFWQVVVVNLDGDGKCALIGAHHVAVFAFDKKAAV